MEALSSQVSPGTVYLVWGVSLLLALVVTAVVAYLLRQIERTARRIHHTVAEIWTTGQQIAAATIHIPDLAITNRMVDEIHAAGGRILEAAAAIHEHAESCPGCPQCVLGRAQSPGGAP